MMRSAWFWNTERWAAYQRDYHVGHVDFLPEYKSSPLAADHDFSDLPVDYEVTAHRTRVVDLTVPETDLWRGVRDSYHSLVHGAQDRYTIEPHMNVYDFQRVHAIANGRQPRSNATYDHQGAWLKDGCGMLMGAKDREGWKAFSYWILWGGCAYYASGPSTERSVQHGVIWESLVWLKAHGFRRAELGPVDGRTQKEANIGKFKSGFGGAEHPYYIAARRET